MVVLSAASLLDAVRRTGMLSASQLKEVEATILPRCPNAEALVQELVQRGWITAFQARQLLLGRGEDLVLGPYLLLAELGRGGWSRVFKARHRETSNLVALKVLRGSLGHDHEAVQRFYREIEAFSRLQHPNIARAVEAGPMGTLLVQALEFIDGVDLQRRVEDSGPLPETQSCDYLQQAAAAMHYVHQQGLVHRDIKPSNLIVQRAAINGADVVKIVDFGLARLQQTVKASTLTLDAGNAMQGTPDYMAPEQALDFHNADIRADIYSLGCVFYFLRTGQLLFSANTLAEKLMKHQQLEPPIPKEWPEPLKALVGRMLAKKPEDRFATPAEVVRALQPFTGKMPDMAVPAVKTAAPAATSVANGLIVRVKDRWSRSSRKQRMVLGAGFAGLVLLGLVIALIGSAGPPQPAPIDEEPAPAKAAAPVRTGLEHGLVGHWKFDEKEGATTADALGNFEPARLFNFDLARCWVPGKIGNAIYCDGVDDYVEVADRPALKVGKDNADFSITFWINLQQQSPPATHRTLIRKGASDQQRTFAIMLLPSANRVHYRVSTAAEANDGGDSQAALTLNRWTHLAYIKAGNYLSLYLDGVSDSGVVLKGPVVVNDGPLYIGKDPWTAGTNAWIDELRIYSRALTAYEIKTLARR